VADNLTEEIQKLNERISELESMLSKLIRPLQQVQNSTSQYFRLVQLALEHGGLSPDLIVPEIKDPISREIIRALLDRSEQNISEITERVRNKRGTASRRIIRLRLNELTEKEIVEKHQKGSLYVYSLTEHVLEKWAKLLGLSPDQPRKPIK
jgi:DNA-binding transcriptional ArsR family regulator